MVLRPAGRGGEDRVRAILRGQNAQGAVLKRRIVQGRLLPGYQGQAGPARGPRQLTTLRGGQTVLWDIGVRKRWLGPVGEVRGGNTNFRPAACYSIRKLAPRHQRTLARQVGHQGIVRPNKDYVAPEPEEVTPPSELSYDLSDWGDVLRTIYEPDCDCEICSRY